MTEEPDDLEIEIAQPTREYCDEIFQWQLPILPAFALVPINPMVVYHEIWTGLSGGICYIARRQGDIVGTLCLYEDTPMYSDVPFIRDKWFCVTAEEEGRGAGKALITAARNLGIQRGRVVLLTRLNPGRHAAGLGLYAGVMGFIPMGKAIVIHNPAGGLEGVQQQEDDDPRGHSALA